MEEKKKRKELLILNVLRDAGAALTSARIAERLVSLGHEMSERSGRL